ncbi:MAG: hypothetical protein M1426_04030 [Patescibacteria group bacterium]|nr:hypothetical protein [Patescibacteria group bacterium]
MPSAGDESTAIGAAQALYFRLRKNNQALPAIEAVKDLYLGPQYSDKEIEQALGKIPKKNIKVQKISNVEQKVAEILSKGNAVARFSGRMEWGARALGNRSILADPSNLKIIKI